MKLSFSNTQILHTIHIYSVYFNSLHPLSISCRHWLLHRCLSDRKFRWKERSGVPQPLVPDITSPPTASLTCFGSPVFIEAPQQQGGAFFHLFPSTFALHSLWGFSLKEYQISWHREEKSHRLEYYTLTVKSDQVMSVFTDHDQGEMVEVMWENTCRNFLYISWFRI